MFNNGKTTFIVLNRNHIQGGIKQLNLLVNQFDIHSGQIGGFADFFRNSGPANHKQFLKNLVLRLQFAVADMHKIHHTIQSMRDTVSGIVFNPNNGFDVLLRIRHFVFRRHRVTANSHKHRIG